MYTLKDFQRDMILLMAFGMIIAFIIGWAMSDNFAKFTAQRNATVRTEIVTLTVVEKGILPHISMFQQRQYYLALSNGKTIRVSLADYNNHEVGQSYDFKLTEQIVVTQKLTPF
ncbi:MAG: hypothetical protein FWE68_05490 [Defluviitaleaceae bacterium]|nr:hypothetical protein [Defluviitaleaceae bacterium]